MKAVKSIKYFSLQQDEHDCGVMCLKNILAYYGADISMEKLREWSGTALQGTTLLGLFQAAEKAGFSVQGAKADCVCSLSDIKHPCILHVTLDDKLLHYVVYYPDKQTGQYLIGDPASGIKELTKEQLLAIWKTKTILILEPGEKIKKWQQIRKNKLAWIWMMLKENSNLLYAALFLGIFAAILNLSMAVFSQKLIDTILPSGSRTKLFLAIALLVVLLSMRSFFTWLRQQLLLKQAYHFNNNITNSFYKNLIFLGKSFFDSRKTGDMIVRLNDTLRIQQAVSYIFTESLIQVLIMLSVISLLLLYSVKIGLLCILILPLIYSVVKYYESEIIERQQQVMSTHSYNESNYIESIRGIHTIKAMNRENMFIGITKAIFSGYQHSIWNLGKTKARFGIALEITTIFFLLAVIASSAFAYLDGTIKIGGLIAILQLSGLLVQSTISAALTNLQIQEAAVALDRLYEFKLIEPEYEQDKNAVASINDLQVDKMAVTELRFRFPGRTAVLENISLEIKKGELIVITGESGQGKSTLFQVLQKFYTQESGSITINGDREFASIHTVDWRKVIGVVPQDITVFSGTVAANICMDTEEKSINKIIMFCERFGFARFFNQLPQGYYTIVGEGGITLSGGQKQLLAMARCLYHQPQVLLLDEPTAAMDAETELFIIHLLQEIKRQTLVLIISHRDSLTQIADRIYNMAEGKTSLVSVIKPGFGYTSLQKTK